MAHSVVPADDWLNGDHDRDQYLNVIPVEFPSSFLCGGDS